VAPITPTRRLADEGGHVATTIERLDLLYCEGWDSRSRAAKRPLSLGAAQERERAGEQYAVLLLDRGTPTALVELSSRCRSLTVWHFDDQMRRAARHELRRVGNDELFPAEQVRWGYADRRRPEFDHRAPRHTRRLSPGGLVHEIDEPDGGLGGSRHRFGRARDWPVRHRMPQFGDPAALADLAAAVAEPLTVVACEPPRSEVAISPLVPVPWQPPAPSGPGRPAPMFDDGARFQMAGHDREVTVEVRRVGQLRLPTGKLVAADVHGLAAAAPFTARVAPGHYPVSVSRLRCPDPPAPPTVAAVRVEVLAAPVSTWELALRPYRNPCSLGSWHFFGFEVTSGTACVADAAACGAMSGEPERERLATVPVGQVVELTDPGSTTNLLAFPAGPGAYPTWVGRTRDGDVACFVADLLRLPDANPAGRR
jgi:hypothetical protein